MRRPVSWQWKEYSMLRDKTLKMIPDNVDIFKIKQEFRHLVPAKRRFERISNIRQLVQVRDANLNMMSDSIYCNEI